MLASRPELFANYGYQAKMVEDNFLLQSIGFNLKMFCFSQKEEKLY